MCAPPDSRQENAFSAHRRTKSAPPQAAGQPHNGQHVITTAPQWQLAGGLSCAQRPDRSRSCRGATAAFGCLAARLPATYPPPHGRFPATTAWLLPRQPPSNGKTSLNGKRSTAAEIARPADTTTPYRHPTAAEHRSRTPTTSGRPPMPPTRPKRPPAAAPPTPPEQQRLQRRRSTPHPPLANHNLAGGAKNKGRRWLPSPLCSVAEPVGTMPRCPAPRGSRPTQGYVRSTRKR